MWGLNWKQPMLWLCLRWILLYLVASRCTNMESHYIKLSYKISTDPCNFEARQKAELWIPWWTKLKTSKRRRASMFFKVHTKNVLISHNFTSKRGWKAWTIWFYILLYSSIILFAIWIWYVIIENEVISLSCWAFALAYCF